MTVGKKIIAGYVAVLVLLVVVAAAGFYSTAIVQDAYREFIEEDVKLIENANTLKVELVQQIAEFRASLLFLSQQSAYLDQLRESYRRFDDALMEMRHSVRSETGIQLLDEIAILQAQLKEKYAEIISRAQNTNRETVLGQNEEIGTDEALPVTRRLIERVDSLLLQKRQWVANDRAGVATQVNRNAIVTVSFVLIAIIIGLGVGFYLSRSIGRQLQESIAQLTTSAAEISAVTTQVSSSASETAAAVSETMATVDEVKQTAQVSNQQSKHVSEQAKKAAQVAEDGAKTVDDLLTGMHHIREQMEAVAESIAALSEQSQNIAEITVVVDNLADQSNLLAVNAAIEAAKAGEYGKGFAVVAQEVKNLAEQSRRATAQVREILEESRQKTHRAVLATEQSNKAAESGLQQVQEAEISINALTDMIAEAAQAAVQIAASSQQQAVGMDQIALAMRNIEQATAQNVAGAKQTESAAHHLNNLSHRLTQMVQRRKA